MGSFRIRFVLGLIALSLGHVSGAADTSGIIVRQYENVDYYNDSKINEIAKLSAAYDLNEETVILFHGFNETVDAESVKTIANAYIANTDSNVIAIDYSQIAINYSQIVDDKTLIVDVIRVNDFAEAIGRALSQMVNNGMISKKIHMIGYSLGAQLAAHIKPHFDFPIDRITGLSPAGPPIYQGISLKSGDANFVDIIHTDSGVFGELLNSGNADFHPNGGLRPQPGCEVFSSNKTQETNCNTARSWMYYAESIRNPNGFMAVQCSSSAVFNLGNCNLSGAVVPMGYATRTNATGRFYLRTLAQSPFAEGMGGIY
ncbi:pancreatic triacylglycerol lipase-like [Lasioglossum baleicum]|uniref:pancreatic triacylglycerol lipase-like n=1 Tax=Lasioglossum baleicum TaxID=434251 RepID=UPI003FCECCEC